MRDVAALAGVGTKTVSRVFNQVPTVDRVLVERVRSAAITLGYRPNLTASNLRRSDQRTHTVGLLVDDVSNPFAARVLRALELFFRQRETLVLAGSLDDDPERERMMAQSFIDRRVDGLVIMPSGEDQRYLVAEQQAGTPMVFIDRPPVPLIADAVVTNNREAARRLVGHMIGTTGRRRVAYLGDRAGLHTARERLAGYRDATRAAGLELSDSLVQQDLRNAHQARSVATRMLLGEAPPDALFTSQNLVTLGAVQALHDLRRQHDVALAGFDDVNLAGVVEPGVTVMAQDPEAIGSRAAELLLARIGGDDSPPRVVTVATTLITRGSAEL